MRYTKYEIIQYVSEEDVKFIRLAFCDVFEVQKNIAIMPEELPRAFEYGIAIDASAIRGFGDVVNSDLLLHPDPDTLAELAWRPETGKVVRMYADITYPDGTPFECDTRTLLKQAIKTAELQGYTFAFGEEQEFYLFKLDDIDNRTYEPYDNAGYMDIAPEDRGENIRREICLTLEKMGIHPERSHHEEGPGQNEIDFRYSDPLTAADNALTFQMVVKTIARRNGLYADFSPKPLKDAPGNGCHINVSVKPSDNFMNLNYMIAGILDKIQEMTLFFNPKDESYSRFGGNKAPRYISWSAENRSQLIRIPAAQGEYCRAELRSPDNLANPYLSFALLIHAGLYGINNRLALPDPVNENLQNADPEIIRNLRKLPETFKEAASLANSSSFVKSLIPQSIIDTYSK
ncbi:MAG: glutamine synthetase family protein [Agathobacter sp.]|nr:glutamine synthetase family protein [Agathobacter sp.]